MRTFANNGEQSKQKYACLQPLIIACIQRRKRTRKHYQAHKHLHAHTQTCQKHEWASTDYQEGTGPVPVVSWRACLPACPGTTRHQRVQAVHHVSRKSAQSDMNPRPTPPSSAARTVPACTGCDRLLGLPRPRQLALLIPLNLIWNLPLVSLARCLMALCCPRTFSLLNL